MEFNEQAFREKFKELDTEHEGRLDKNLIAQLLRDFDLEQHRASVDNVIRAFDLYARRFQFVGNQFKKAKSIEVVQEEDEDDAEEEKSSVPEVGFDYKLSVEEAVKYANFIRNKIKFEIWKKTCGLLGLEYIISHKTKRTIFPLKDPAQEAKLNVVIGKEHETYNSFLHVDVAKIPSLSPQPPCVEIKIITGNQAASQQLESLWKEIYETISGMVEEELPDGGAFLKSIKITTEATEHCFLLRAENTNPQANEFAKTLSEMGDIIFKTTLKFRLNFRLDFNFNVGEFISNEKASLYDFLAQNVRINLNFQGSEYVTALKELMIANDAFSDLSYVADDSFSLTIIALVNMQKVDLNLRFGNDFLSESEQETLKEVLGLLMKGRELTAEFEEGMPHVFNFIKCALKSRIEVRIRAYDFKVDLTLNIPSLDQLLFQNSVLLGGGGEQ